MKTAVVFYTRDGNTRLAANLLAKRLGADVFELEEVKKRGRSAASFMAAGFGASFGFKSRLKSDYAQEMKAYDTICIGSPVWAGKTVPAVNAFVNTLEASGKKIILFTVQADPHPEERPPVSLEAYKATLENKGGLVAKMLRMHGAPPGKTVDEADLQTQISHGMTEF